MRADEALFPHDGTVEDRRPHPDEAFIADGAGVHVGRVPDRHPVPDQARIIIRQMQDGIVLHVGIMPDDDPVDVPAEHGPVPDAAPVPQRDIAHHHRRPGEVHTLSKAGSAPEMPVELCNQSIHASESRPRHTPSASESLSSLLRARTLPLNRMEGAAETTSDLLGHATARLAAAGIESAGIEAELLLEHVTGIPRLRRRIGLAPTVGPTHAETFRTFIERRTQRVPLQHLVGFADFLDLRIRVTPDVLIPRPETEQLVLRARERLPSRPHVQVADLGTGSGCIALAMAATRPDVRVDAFDLSGAALEVARENAVLNGLQERITFHQAGVFGPEARLVEGRTYDLIVTNPPYIPTGELADLMPEVRDHDPRLALDGGPDGLAPYRHLALLAQDWLHTGGWLLAEFGDGQAQDLHRIFAAHAWSEISIEKDLSDRDRILIVRTSRPRNPANQLGIGDGGLPAHSHHG